MAESAEGNEVKMQAYGFSRSGSGSLELLDPIIPKPKKGEVLVKVHFVSLSSDDSKYDGQKTTFIPATAIAGEISDIGPGVTKFRNKNSVISKLPLITSGGLAEYVVAPVNLTIIRPPQLPAVEGSGLGTALTALQALNLLEAKYDGSVPSGKTRNILITDASGGVGHYAVQLAKLSSFHITAACKGSTNSGDFLKELGADEVVYKNDDGSPNFSSPSGTKYDCVVDCGTGIAWSDIQPNLNPTAKVIYTQPTRRHNARSLNLFSNQKVFAMKLKPTLENLEILVNLALKGKIKTHVDSSHSLRNAKEAWAKSMADDVKGNVVVKLID